jgi:hypothetical protein
MKQLFLILLSLSLCTGSFAQVKDSAVKATDSTALITVKDVVEFDALMQQKFSVRELGTYQELLKWWQDKISQRVREFEAKKKGGK